MTSRLRIALGQVDCLVGDIPGNASRIVEAARRAEALGAEVLLLPELCLSGYPPEDLLFHRGFRTGIAESMARLREELPGTPAVVVGYPEYDGDTLYNAAAVFQGGAIIANHRKQLLPNYQVFDEKRYFHPGAGPTCFEVGGVRVALLICEDVWQPAPSAQARQAGAELGLVINASPFEQRKRAQREAILRERALETGMAFAYANLVGGQDELVFDGQSLVVDSGGRVVHRAPAFSEDISLAEYAPGRAAGAWAGEIHEPFGPEHATYEAIVTGVRDYVAKHGFPGVVIGLSGGIDSALVLAIAVDALGADRVHAVMMPSRYTSTMSLEDAEAMARGLRVKYSLLPIEAMFESALETLAAEFRGLPEDATEENIQARCRGILLMAISNKTGRIVLTTGNKSEMAVGYATLYGDMAGGFAPIKDCSKLLVFRLSRWRNTRGAVIPQRIIDRPPSAELRADQRDTDSLPPYEILDPILEDFIERDLSVKEIVAQGYDGETVARVLEMVRRNEYKRRQAPPGVRISARAFGRDWRYPITSGYRPGRG